METLIINVPEDKSVLVKQILEQLGVLIEKKTLSSKKPSDYIGAISKKTAKELLQSVNESRQQWERDI